MNWKKSIAVAGSLLMFTAAMAQKTTTTKKPAGVAAQPKIIIGMMVDQMRWDYLYRFQNRYGPDGFKRLLKEGFTCENTLIDYTPTITACGHTCV